MTMDDKNKFLYASLADLQSSIRAIDTKVSYLLIILIIPLTTPGKIYNSIEVVIKSETLELLSVCLVVLFIVSWILGFWCVLRTIIAIDNPKNHISGELPKSTFYPANLFKHTILGVLFNKKTISSLDYGEYYDSISEDKNEIAKQLSFEQMKIMYILSLKCERSKIAYYSVIFWIAIGGVLWFLYFFLKNAN